MSYRLQSRPVPGTSNHYRTPSKRDQPNATENPPGPLKLPVAKEQRHEPADIREFVCKDVSRNDDTERDTVLQACEQTDGALTAAVAKTTTKDDLAQLATSTKDDLARLATREDLKDVNSRLNEVSSKLDEVRDERRHLATKEDLRDVSLRLDRAIEKSAGSQTEVVLQRITAQLNSLIAPLIERAGPKQSSAGISE